MAISHIIHLQLLETDEHYYFGSLKTLTDMFDKDTIGITYGSLRSYISLNDYPFKNKKCIIRKGLFHQTETNRGQGRRNNPVGLKKKANVEQSINL